MRRTAQMTEAQETREHAIWDEARMNRTRNLVVGGTRMVRMMDVRREQTSCWMDEMRRVAAVTDRGSTRTWAAPFILSIY